MKHAALLVLRLSAIMIFTLAFTTQTASACSLNPVANITSPVNMDVYYKGEGVSLDGSTSVAMCSPSTLTYTWSVRQSSFHSWTQVYNGSNPTYLHTFPTAASTWQVRLKVTNAGSKTHTRTVTNIHVVNEPESQYHITDHLGSPRVVFSRSGTVLSWTDYYPFGGILPGRSGTSAIDHDNIKFTGYEKESEGGLDTYHAEARGYDPVIGRFTGRDPHAQHYPDWSPYHYAANNPVSITDPTGMDWYSSNDGAVKWVEGSDDIEGYANIGANYTHNIGGGISITYYQIVAESITFTAMGAEGWVSQIANGINCHEACTTMLSNEGFTTAGRSTEVVMTNTGENGRPVIFGVDYKSGSPNADGMTDHFVVVSGKTETLSNGRVTSTSYRYIDARTSHSSFGTQATNQFRLQNNRLVGTYQQGARINFYYTVTAIRRNR